MFIKKYDKRISIDNILWYDETSMIDHKNIEQFGIKFRYKVPLNDNLNIEDTIWFLDKNERDHKLKELDEKVNLLYI